MSSARLIASTLMLLFSACCATASPPTQKTDPKLVDASGVALKTRIRATSSKVTIVNVWATWCDPCKEELPDFLRLYRRYRDRSVDLMLVSADVDEARPAALVFLARTGVDFPTYFKIGGDMEFIDALEPQWSGALPATMIYGPGGKLVHFVEGSLTYDQLEKYVLDVLQSGS